MSQQVILSSGGEPVENKRTKSVDWCLFSRKPSLARFSKTWSVSCVLDATLVKNPAVLGFPPSVYICRSACRIPSIPFWWIKCPNDAHVHQLNLGTRHSYSLVLGIICGVDLARIGLLGMMLVLKFAVRLQQRLSGALD